jgi:hypothetical protein
MNRRQRKRTASNLYAGRSHAKKQNSNCQQNVTTLLRCYTVISRTSRKHQASKFRLEKARVRQIGTDRDVEYGGLAGWQGMSRVRKGVELNGAYESHDPDDDREEFCEPGFCHSTIRAQRNLHLKLHQLLRSHSSDSSRSISDLVVG